VVRGAAVGLAALAPTPWLWRVATGAWHDTARGVPVQPAEALTGVVAGGALAVLVVLALGVLLELLAQVPGAIGSAARRMAALVTPGLVRRAVGVALGAAVVAGVAPGAAAGSPPTSVLAPAPPPDPSFAPLPDPGFAPTGTSSTTSAHRWVPSAPLVRAQPDVRVLSPAPRAGTTRDAPLEVVVRRGDSLWAIAARHLGSDASDAEIARAWPAWYEANRHVVGDDPDRLRPGQLLRAPGTVPS